MKYYSEKNRSKIYSFREAVLKGLADDGGLFMPEDFPIIKKDFIESLHKRSIQEIAYEISSLFIDDNISKSKLADIVDRGVKLDAPLIKLSENIFTLELFHGPTLSFKDFGAQFMAKIFEYLMSGENKSLNVLVATSGDTGSAIANGFYCIEGINVFVLYPSGKVSEIQEKQFTTLGKNVFALEINGTFDDCQRLVKRAFVDNELALQLKLTSANSINISRLIPQMFYYFRAVAQIQSKKDIAVSVPSGNFGNITAGLFAEKIGLPIKKFIASTNINDIVPKYLATGVYEPRESIQTISNAMDVGDPSNFKRIECLFNYSLNNIKSNMSAYSFSEEKTKLAMKEIYQKYGYFADPHGAVGYCGLIECLKEKNNFNGIFLETAHPAKFIETVKETLGKKPSMNETLMKFLDKEKNTIKLSANYDEFREILINVQK